MFEYLEAFYFLSNRRTVGFSAENPISTQDIQSYLSLNPTDNTELFMYLIAEMDHEYLSIKYAKVAKSVDKSSTTKSSDTMSGNKF